MWTRSLLKSNAKAVLARGYWHIWLGCLIAALLGGGIAVGGASVTRRFSAADPTGQMPTSGNMPASPQFALMLLLTMLVFLLVALVVTLCIVAFVSLPVQVGLCRFMMESRSGKSPFGTLFSLFRSGCYLRTVGTMLLTRIKIFLWGLLLIVPGVIKGYEYYFVPFLLAENPHLSCARAQQLSREISNGEKGRMFVLDLSFFGWYFLVAVAAAICLQIGAGSLLAFIVASIVSFMGNLCLAPYYSATFAELYAAMREKALAMGMAQPEELGGFIQY